MFTALADWQEPQTAKSISSYSPALYRAVCRTILRRQTSGTYADLQKIAEGKEVHGFGPVNRKKLANFLSQAKEALPPRPIITRTTAQVAASLTPKQQAEVQSIALDLDELRRENPLARLPESALRVWLLGRVGVEWDFRKQDWGWADRGIAYLPTAQGLALLAAENK